jgi:hypothetical protein
MLFIIITTLQCLKIVVHNDELEDIII